MSGAQKDTNTATKLSPISLYFQLWNPEISYFNYTIKDQKKKKKVTAPQFHYLKHVWNLIRRTIMSIIICLVYPIWVLYLDVWKKWIMEK